MLGVVREDGGIGAPSGEGQRFVVSYRSEEALGQSLGRNVLWLGLGAIGAFVVGVFLALIGLVVLLG